MSSALRNRNSVRTRVSSLASMGLVLWALAIAGPSVAESGSQPASGGAHPTFSREVLPLLQAHCQECHRPGQIAPMSFLDYQQVRPWAKAIRKAVLDRSMPPFRVNAPLGHFEGDLRLTDDEVGTLVSWIDGGALEGNPADAPPPRTWPSNEWVAGKPDLVLEFPEFTTKSNNKDEELLLYSNYLFPADTWTQAIEFRLNDYTVVHHAGISSVDNTFFVPEDRVIDSEDEHLDKFGGASNGGLPLIGQTHLYTWLPGQNVMSHPDGEGFNIVAGNRIVIQIHIAPTTEAKRIKVELGLRFVNGELRTNGGLKVSQMKQLRVPPGAPSYVLHEWRQFNNNVTVNGFNAHMHLRGKSSQIIFHYPDGHDETVLDVPHYDFNWQRIYKLTTPMQVPKGTKIEFVAEWDNSADNPLNPDPAAELTWGGRTTDEMYGGNVYFSVPRVRPVRVAEGRIVDAPAP